MVKMGVFLSFFFFFLKKNLINLPTQYIFYFYFLIKKIIKRLVKLSLHCCVLAFSNCGDWGLPLLPCMDFSLWWLLLLQSTGSRHETSVVATHRLNSCSSQALECRLSSCGAGALVAPLACGIFPDWRLKTVPFPWGNSKMGLLYCLHT